MTVSFVLGTGNDAVYAQQIGRGVVGDIEYSYSWSSVGGGFTSAAFSLVLPTGYDHRMLRTGTPVRMHAGGVALGTGRISEVDRAEWRVTVEGDVKRGDRFNAEDSGADPTTNLRTAVVEANVRGMGWNGYGSIPDVVLSVDAEDRAEVNRVSQLLTRYCQLNNKRWGLDASGAPYLADDPTTPSLLLRPGVPGLPTVEGDYVTRLTVRYATAVDGDKNPTAWDTVVATAGSAPLGAFEDAIDVSDLGLLDPTPITATAVAQAYANAMMAARSARMTFSAGVDGLRYWQVAGVGNVSPALWLPMAGRMVRHYGVLSDSGALAFGRTLDWVVGRSVHRQVGGDSWEVALTPVDVAARDLPRLLAAVDPASPKRSERRATIQLGA